MRRNRNPFPNSTKSSFSPPLELEHSSTLFSPATASSFLQPTTASTTPRKTTATWDRITTPFRLHNQPPALRPRRYHIWYSDLHTLAHNIDQVITEKHPRPVVCRITLCRALPEVAILSQAQLSWLWENRCRLHHSRHSFYSTRRSVVHDLDADVCTIPPFRVPACTVS